MPLHCDQDPTLEMPVDLVVTAQQTLWGQCGGNRWNGPKTCVSGARCEEINPWYFQCLPGAATTHQHLHHQQHLKMFRHP